jgi:predicted transcriptional regulator
VREYLAALLENNLLSYDAKSGILKTTEKGHRFLKITEELGRLAQPVIEGRIRKN